MQQDVTVVLGSDTVIIKGVAMQAATNLSLTPAQAAALTGIALAPSGATGGVATITAARSLAELWQYFRAWKPTNMTSEEAWSYNGLVLNVGAWTIVGVENLSGGTLVTSVATANGAISNLTITGNVNQTTPTNLTNVTIIGTLSYNTATTLSVTYTGVNVTLVKNDGVGIVSIAPSGTVVISDYSDPQINYLDSTLTVINATSAIVFASAVNRDGNISPGATVSPTLAFKHGSTLSGVPMTGTVYFRVTAGSSIFLASLTLSVGANILDLGIPGQLALIPGNSANAVWSLNSAGFTTPGTFGYDANMVKAMVSTNPHLL